MVTTIDEAATYIKRQINTIPQICIILGSGLGDALTLDSADAEISYSDIPHFPMPQVEGHKGIMTIGHIGKKPVAVLRGRPHYYEGYSLTDVIMPIRVMRMLGAECLIVTGAAGAAAKGLKPGDIMLITDHINFISENPLRGRNADYLGERFPDMTNVYTEELLGLAREAGEEMGLVLKSGVYLAVSGPSYETPAEVRMLRSLGADAIGMSVVPEAIAAAHAKMNVLGVACITNMAAGIAAEHLSHDDVLEMGKRLQHNLSELLKKVVLKI